MPAALMQPELAAARVSTYRSIITCPTRAEFKLVAVDQTLELKQTHRQSTMANQRLATVFPELDGRRLPSLRRHELASCCSRLGLVSSGNRHALLSRLSTALQAGAQIPPPPGTAYRTHHQLCAVTTRRRPDITRLYRESPPPVTIADRRSSTGTSTDIPSVLQPN